MKEVEITEATYKNYDYYLENWDSLPTNTYEQYKEFKEQLIKNGEHRISVGRLGMDCNKWFMATQRIYENRRELDIDDPDRVTKAYLIDDPEFQMIK